ncbi:MAG TPA: hypothetical protein VGM76_10515 [Lacipirellulaceae bacterium]
MRTSPTRNPQSEIRNSAAALPVWWRYVLVAAATLILCSCQALPPLPLPPQDGQSAAADATTSESPVVVSDSSPQNAPVATMELTETRELSAQEITPTFSFRPPNVVIGQTIQPAVGDESTAQCNCACNSCGRPSWIGPGDEYLCDGGDFGLPAGVRADWTVDGVEQEDTVAHYDTVSGNVIVTPSNRVCIYAPRFAAVRRVESVAAEERRLLIGVAEDDLNLANARKAQPVAHLTQRHAVAIDLGEQPANLFRSRQQAGGLEDLLATIDVKSTLAAYAALQIIRTGEVVGSEKSKLERSVQNAVTWSGDQAVQVVFENKQAIAAVGVKQPGIVYENGEPSSPRLRLVKIASTNHALPGEEVEFTLRFDNIGDQVIGNVTIVDNLATRLEYESQSAKSSTAAGFSAVPNGEGSTVLRWEIKDPVKPADGGILQFTCRVR